MFFSIEFCSYQVWTLWAASLLFLVFGLKMLQEGMTMRSGTSHIQEEMREVEEELEEDSSRHDTQNPRGGSSVPLEALEEGKVDMDMGMGYEGGRGSFSSGSRNRDGSPASPRRFSSSTMGFRPSSPRSSTAGLPRHAHAPGRGPSINFPLSGSGGGHSSYDGNGKKAMKSWIGGLKEGSRNAIQLMTNPVFAQAFVLTFLGEWGDRSQITTIAMGGAHVSGG
jgi:putative Ca2+/H+ antiporter (TMEM165/GDT1 family)